MFSTISNWCANVCHGPEYLSRRDPERNLEYLAGLNADGRVRRAVLDTSPKYSLFDMGLFGGALAVVFNGLSSALYASSVNIASYHQKACEREVTNAFLTSPIPRNPEKYYQPMNDCRSSYPEYLLIAAVGASIIGVGAGMFAMQMENTQAVTRRDERVLQIFNETAQKLEDGYKLAVLLNNQKDIKKYKKLARQIEHNLPLISDDLRRLTNLTFDQGSGILNRMQRAIDTVLPAARPAT